MPGEVERLYDARLAKAVAHPLRARILQQLERRTASPSDLAQELAAPLGNVSYHVRILAEAGLIELVRTTRRRGATEHHYRAVSKSATRDLVLPQPPEGHRAEPTSTERPPESAEPAPAHAERPQRADRTQHADRPDSPQRARRGPRAPSEAAAGGDADAAVRETVDEIRAHVRTTTAHPDVSTAHVTRTTLVLDDVAWHELHAAVERLHDLALQLQVESAPRLRRVQHENEHEANLVLMLYEGSDPAVLRVLRGGVGERRGRRPERS